ncbi:tRNA delta(2)-isopentenylpyrophosphate transferase, putative [Ricinus communis]|uniref:tRNA delta(2)-isopentenylpyrophosphate transferase, putative n=1 Tax=Ricinus communis TaxID=3988 RepID=B9SSW5_RICCO|nr:tRNA delta(2)-isopentenylpyrophosphate transferase, putative [Ricinus communis]|eukprot:XP_002529084.1 tRNA dimethylallyltransferase 2 isoform X1 [Ricinus communis]
MGPTGSGKSKLAIDLATHFPVEIINADSMQVYHGLDVLTNKVPLYDQKGVPHHLLGTISPNVEFTAKEFRDSAIPLIKDILSRNCFPVIVGGTNYYIQALVSPFLLDDTAAEDLDDSFVNEPPGDEQTDQVPEFESNGFDSYDYLKELDPVAANRVHPNNHRKINQYLNLYARSGILPSKLYLGKAAENWGRIDNCRFDCCFICVDAATPVLDQYVGQRVDCMIDAGLLCEVYDIYNPYADYTRGLQQAIGVREFEDVLRAYLSDNRNDEANDSTDKSLFLVSTNNDKMLKNNMREILRSSDDNEVKVLLTEAIDKVKLNTRRLVRRQKRRITRLNTLFGWNIHYVDATESISCKSDESWAAHVVEPAVEIIRSFLRGDKSSVPVLEASVDAGMKRNLWTQYICKACGDKVLRGAHEWEQHKQGRGHRKRSSRFRKTQGQGLTLAEGEYLDCT